MLAAIFGTGSHSAHGLARMLLVPLLLMAACAGAGAGERYQLRTVSFEAPDGWSVSRRSRDQEFDFQSPDGKAELWARWWFPDEPLLGFPDIVSHKSLTVAGQKALFVHLETRSQRTFELAFLKRDEEGEQFLLQLHADRATMSEAEQKALFDKLVGALVYDGVPAGDQRTEAQPQPESPSQQPQAATGGEASIVMPEGWRNTALKEAPPGVRQWIVASPQNDQLVLAAVAEPADGQDALAVIDGFVGFLYRDYIVVKSIDGESYPEIAGQTVHAIETTAKVFPIADVPLPYKRGKVEILRGGDKAQAFLIVTIRAENAPPQVAETLKRVAESFAFTAPGGAEGVPEAASGAAPTAVTGEAPRGDTPMGDASAGGASTGEEGAAARAWLPALQERYGSDCDLVNLAAWRSPVRDVLEQAQVKLLFVAVCARDGYTIFGVNFRYDPRTATSDYFHPLYAKTFEANGRRPFAFLETRDGVAAEIGAKDGKTLMFHLEEMTPPPPEQNKTENDMKVVPADADTRTGSRATAKASDTAAATPESAADEAGQWQAALTPEAAGLLFDGRRLKGLVGLGSKGGDFNTQARLEAGGLLISIPKGMGAAKTGVASGKPVVQLPYPGAPKALEIALTTQMADDTRIFLDLTPAANAAKAPGDGSDIHMELRRGAKGEGLYVVRVRDQPPAMDGRFSWPAGKARLAVVLTPDQTLELRDAGGNRLFAVPLPDQYAGRQWLLQLYTQPASGNDPAQLLIEKLGIDLIDPSEQVPPGVPMLLPGEQVLFDGKGLGWLWEGFSRDQNAFSRFSRFEDGALRILQRKGEGRGTIGLYSPEAVVWPDRLEPEGEIRLKVSLSGRETSGFEFALQAPHDLNGNIPGNGAFFFAVTGAEGGGYLATAGVRPGKPTVAATLSAVPDSFTVVLRPGTVAVEAAGVPATPISWSAAENGRGLRLYLLTRADPKTGTDSLVVREIRAIHKPSPRDALALPAAGVAPLPLTTLFNGRMNEAWQVIEAGDNKFSELATETPDGLTLRRADKISNGNRIGIITREPLVDLDRRILRTDYLVRLRIDPRTADLATRISLSADRDNPEKDGAVRVMLQNVTSGPFAGRLRVELRMGYYAFWTRYLEPGWHQASWDGTLSIRLGDRRVSVDFGEGIMLAAEAPSIGPGFAPYLSVRPGGINREKGSVTLRTVVAGWDTPAGMSAAQRWTFMDDATFDPKSYLTALTAEIDGGGR